jgi:hypothetical protein
MTCSLASWTCARIPIPPAEWLWSPDQPTPPGGPTSPVADTLPRLPPHVRGHPLLQPLLQRPAACSRVYYFCPHKVSIHAVITQAPIDHDHGSWCTRPGV